MDTYYIDGEFVEDGHAMIPAKDITVLRGYGVFDFLITYNKRPFHLDAHVARLENSAREIGLGTTILKNKGIFFCELEQKYFVKM